MGAPTGTRNSKRSSRPHRRLRRALALPGPSTTPQGKYPLRRGHAPRLEQRSIDRSRGSRSHAKQAARRRRRRR